MPARINIQFPDDVLRQLREAVPAGRRSEFIVEGTRLHLLRERQRQALALAAGAWAEPDAADRGSEEEARRILDEVRGRDDARASAIEQVCDRR